MTRTLPWLEVGRRRPVASEGHFDTRFSCVWDSADSDQSDGGSLMTHVPIVHVTEMLAHAFGILANTVVPQPHAPDRAVVRFLITDRDGACWFLDVSDARQRAADLPAEGIQCVARRWGRYWAVLPAETAGAAAAPGAWVADPASAVARPRLVLNCADGRALERVGSWLTQPAGLPVATDILGQCFVEAWARHREGIAAVHARVEAVRDALGHPAASEVGEGERAGQWPIGSEAYRHQRVLRHLVDSQHILLGPQAAAFPMPQRRATLRRLTALLEAVQAKEILPDTLWRAG